MVDAVLKDQSCLFVVKMSTVFNKAQCKMTEQLLVSIKQDGLTISYLRTNCSKGGNHVVIVAVDTVFKTH